MTVRLSRIAPFVVAAAIAAVLVPVLSQPAAAACQGLNDKLVPQCADQALFGAAANDKDNPMGFADAMRDAQQRYGRDFPIWHSYDGIGKLPLNAGTNQGKDEIAHANSGGIDLVNWKPAGDWSTATGGDSTVNADIAKAADNVKAVAPHKIMLAIYHEPENDVGGGVGGCAVNSGNPSGNTPANYRGMWANVEKIFADHGVTNVVWMDIMMAYSKWDCFRNQMWPGNDLVDWVGFDSYDGSTDWAGSVGHFYDWLNTNSNADRDYKSKPYALAEFGDRNADQSHVYASYADGKAGIDDNTYPNLRAYIVWDSNTDGDIRTDQTSTGKSDPTEQKKFDALATDNSLSPAINS